MKVAPKLVLAAWVAFLPMLALHAWLSVRREEDLFRSQTRHGLALLGRHLRHVVVTEWTLDRAADVKALLEAAAPTDRDVEIDWRPPAPDTGRRGLVPSDADRMTWLEPVRIDGHAVGRIEISESLEPMHRYLRATLLRLALLTAALGLAGIALARAVGERWIGRRLATLVEFARRTGAGELGRRLDVGGNDEISALAASLGNMSAALAVAREQANAANSERIAMLQHLRHADRLAGIGRLASSVAHELGTPLNVAMGHAERIEKEPAEPEAVRRSAEVIRRQMDRMAATIRGILGFVRPAPMRAEAVDVVQVVADVADLMAPFLHEHHVDLAVSSQVERALVQGNRIQLEQVLSNLVANAIDATGGAGSVEVSIARTVREHRIRGAWRSQLEISVRDHGPGVREADRERIFEPFVTSKAEGSGTGLGLWITQGIVHDHGGSIRVENHAEGGASFVVRLPELGAR